MRQLNFLSVCLVVVLFLLGLLLLNALVNGALFTWQSAVLAVLAGIGSGYLLWRVVIRPSRPIETAVPFSPTQPAHRQPEADQQTLTAVNLRQQKELFENLFEYASDIVYILNRDGTVLYVNRIIETAIGYAPSEVLGKHFVAFTHGVDEDILEKQLGQGGINHYEFVFQTKDGRPIVLELNAHFMLHDGKPIAILGIARDISAKKLEQIELQQAKEAAEKATRAKTIFLANMGHELRTPLSVIIGYADIISQDAASDGQSATLLAANKVKQAAQQLRGIVNDVLEITEIETGRLTFLLETFDIAETVNRAVKNCQTAVDAHNNDLLILLPPDVGSMFADQDKVRRALENLLSNAAKFTQNGFITLSVTREQTDGQEWVLFQVADTGIGIAPDQYEKVFRAFDQVDQSFTRGYDGVGLGLAINQHLCTSMGGRIDLVSAPGKGSTFTMRLPVRVTAVDAMFVRKK
ncbi:MAG: PAS domain S-box protein [Chloroflexi bacterium]|nr:PAS domain S-box protein [Chloroflexota bacterium]